MYYTTTVTSKHQAASNNTSRLFKYPSTHFYNDTKHEAFDVAASLLLDHPANTPFAIEIHAISNNAATPLLLIAS